VPVGGRDVTTCGSGRCLLPALDRLSRGRCSAESVQLLQPTPPRPGKTCARAGGCCRSAVSAQRERTAGPRQVAQVPVQKSEPATPGRSGKRRSRQDEGRSGAEKVWCDVMGHGVKTMAWPPECWRTTRGASWSGETSSGRSRPTRLLRAHVDADASTTRAAPASSRASCSAALPARQPRGAGETPKGFP